MVHINKLVNCLIWIISFICLYIILATKLWICIRFPAIFEEDTANKLNDILVNLSYSYIAGVCFYILTVYIPESKKKNALKFTIYERLRYLKDHYYEVGHAIIGEDLTSENGFKLLFKEMTSENYEEYINSQKEKLLECSYNKLLPYIELRKNIRNEINEIMIYKDYLDAKQIDLLLQIRNSYWFNFINEWGVNKPQYFDIDGIKKFIDSLIITARNADNLFSAMKTVS